MPAPATDMLSGMHALLKYRSTSAWTGTTTTFETNGSGQIVHSVRGPRGDDKMQAQTRDVSVRSWQLFDEILTALHAGRWKRLYDQSVMDGAPFHFSYASSSLRAEVQGNMGGPPGWPLVDHAINLIAAGRDDELEQLAAKAQAYGTASRAARVRGYDVDRRRASSTIDALLREQVTGAGVCPRPALQDALATLRPAVGWRRHRALRRALAQLDVR